jgi:hypothetical protein
MKRRKRRSQTEYLAEPSLSDLINIAFMIRPRNMPTRHRYPLPPSSVQYQRRNNGPITRGQRIIRPDPYPLPRRPIPDPTRERAYIDSGGEKRAAIVPDRHPSVNKMQVNETSQRKTSPPTPQNVIPSKLQSPSHPSTPPPPPPPPQQQQQRLPTPPPKSVVPTDLWRIQYFLEKERLSAPPESKPSSLLFFTSSSPETYITESKRALRKITKLYNPDHIFGTAPARKVHLREIYVTFPQIWNRNVFIERWEQQGQDSEGYLSFEQQELKIRLQRHHVPGTLFFATEAGDLNINDDSMVAPDVCFRIVDAPGQNFSRCESRYDLKRTLEIEEGQLEVSFTGIDGKEIKFEIEGRKYVRLPGEGMPRNWEGTNRGDLIIDLVVQ